MKILQVSAAYFPAISIGGPIFSMLALAKLLCRTHTVDTLTTPLGLNEASRESLVFDSFISVRDGGRILYKRFFGYPNLTFSPTSFVWLFGNVKSYDLAVLHGVWNFPMIAAACACRFWRVPYVVFPHGTLYKETIEMHSGWQKKLLLKVVVKGMLEQASRIAFTTDDEAHKVTSYLGYKLHSFVVPNVVSSGDFADLPVLGKFRQKHGVAANTRLLLHYGRITRKKGIEFSILALAALRGQGRDVMLAVVGGDDEGYKDVLDQLLSRLNIADAVVFTGLVDRDEGKTALVDADVFLLPSYSENFGMAVVEAMLCGLPVVISENVGLASALAAHDVGVVVPLAPDAGPLTGAVAALLDDEVRRNSLALRGRQYAIDTFDADAVEQCVEQLLHEACSGRTKN